MRDSMIFYRSFYEAIKELSFESQGIIYNAIYEYGLNKNEVELKGLEKTIFTLIKPQLDANLRKFNNGNKGGRPPKNNLNETELKPKNNLNETKTKANVNDNVNDNVNVNVKEINNISSSTKNEFSQDIIKTFNSVVGYFETKPQTESQKNKWLDCIDKLNRIDGLSFDEIILIVKYAKEDNFWSKNFLSLLKLRNKNKEDIYFWNVFKTQMKPKQETNVSQNSHLKVYV